MGKKGVVSLFGMLLLVAVMFVAPIVDSSAQQAYPNKTVTLVVTFGAGGGGDLTARVLAKYLAKELGQPFTVVNKPGGASIPGTLSVLNGPADGYNLLMVASAQTTFHALQKDLPYKLDENTWTWGPMSHRGQYIYAVSAKSPWKTLKEFVEAAKKNPESIRMHHGGGSTGTDFTLGRMLQLAGIDRARIRKVTYTGGGEAMAALAGGHIDLAGGLISPALGLIASGDIRALAVTGDERSAALPNVPSSKEAGFHVAFSGWSGMVGPKGMPKGVINRIDQTVKKIAQDPEYAKDLQKLSHDPYYQPPERMWPIIMQEIEDFRSLVN